ncbi:MAG: hypothetical protein L6W00_07185 [Lentisphaeria bacterium]|nr:MAG: hypothetical protein L6W00_07185 [Lentisphaeria bacterium]
MKVSLPPAAELHAQKIDHPSGGVEHVHAPRLLLEIFGTELFEQYDQRGGVRPDAVDFKQFGRRRVQYLLHRTVAFQEQFCQRFHVAARNGEHQQQLQCLVVLQPDQPGAQKPFPQPPAVPGDRSGPLSHGAPPALSPRN